MSYGDNPIDTLDQDHLNRAGTVQALQALLTDPQLDTPLALGIYGDWGSGKTSVMRLLKKVLSGHGLCLWFDAWQYAHQQDALWRALMLAVVEGLRQHQPEGLNDEALNRLVTSLYRSQQYVDEKGFKINWQAAVPLTVRAILRLLPVVGVSLGDKVAEKLQESLAEGKDAEEAVRLIERENIQHYREQVQSLEQFQQELRGLIKNHVTDKGRAYTCS